MKKAKHTLAILRWLDHSAAPANEWRHLSDIKEMVPIEFISAGWIISETRRWLTILPHIEIKDGEPKGQGRGEICILKNTILERFDIERFAR